MTDIIEKRDKATALRRQKNFQDALLLFETLWEETKDKWDGWGLALCMCKRSRFKDALNVSKEVYSTDNDFDYIKGTYAWSAFMLNINNYSGDNYDELKSYANGIMQLTENRQEDVFRHLTVLKVMDYCETKGMWEALVSWSRKIDPKILNAEPYKFKKNGKNITMPSNQEKWYLKTSKAYEKSEDWERCFKTASEGLNYFPDEIWLKRRKAISDGNLGNIDKAIEELKNISFVKSDWFIFRDIAIFHGQNNNYSKALDYIIDGCIISANLPDPGYRWELYYDAALFLHKSGNIKMAEKHLLLSYSLRDNEGWKIPEVLSALADELGITLENTNNLFKELKPFWEKHKFSKLPKQRGEIKTIMPNGKAGFITAEKGEDYYFKVMSFNGKRSQLKPGLKVEFYVQESFDRKKEKKSYQAVNIYSVKKE